MMISKKAAVVNNMERRFSFTSAAREAWSLIIDYYRQQNSNAVVLLPSYIGWSANEGSGIFDSVKAAGVAFDFYNVDEHLQIDIEDFKRMCTQYNRPLILLVHYFGLVDKQYDYLAGWLDDNNYFFVEDCAHAMLSDLIGGRCGRRGRYSLYSLHKMLPLDSGGILVNNRPSSQTLAVQSFAACTLDYDLYEIGKARRRNYKLLAGLLNNVSGLTLIEPTLKDGIYPQTLPVIIESDRRDQLYFEMNEKGFGVVSLYHTMIDELKDSKSPAATYTSKHIMNLPVHQDASKEALTIFAEQFKAAL